jgi:hypothetical protein
MAAILIVLGVVIALALYACCVASGQESRREELPGVDKAQLLQALLL